MSSASVRRLRPIYDAVENGRFSTAIQLADQLLKKDKAAHTANALKALSLCKITKTGEAGRICDELMKIEGHSEDTLQALSACLREMGRFEDIVSVYEALHKAAPGSEEAATQFFMALVRTKEYKRQQQVATAMFKRFGNPPYRYWAIMSVVMQAHEARSTGVAAMADRMFLPLAEKMIKVAADEKQLDSPESLRLYVMILELQGKHMDILELLKKDAELGFRADSPLLPPGTEVDRLEVEALTQLQEWAKVNRKLQSMIKGDLDEWPNYIWYFDSVTKLKEATSTESDGTCSIGDGTGDAGVGHSSFSEADSFITDVCAISPPNHFDPRGPYLANLEILVRQPVLGGGMPDSAIVTSRLLQYARLFGAKLCGFSDIRPYLTLVTTCSGGRAFVAAVESCFADIASTETEAKRVQRDIFLLQLRLYFGEAGADMPIADRLEFIAGLMSKYDTALPLGKDLKPTEHQFADPYALIAAQLLLELHAAEGSVGYLYHAAAVLRQALSASHHNVQCRILLAKVLGLLGCGTAMMAEWKLCEVKQIQLDSVGYIANDMLASLGCHTEAEYALAKTLRFHGRTHTELCEFLVNAYQFGSFGKVLEFIRFRERLHNSIQRAAAAVESQYILVASEPKTRWIPTAADMKSVPSTSDLTNLVDNRDFDVMDTWRKARTTVEDTQSRSFEGRVLWVKYRARLLRTLKAVADNDVTAVTAGAAEGQEIYSSGIHQASIAGARGMYPDGTAFALASPFARLAEYGFGIMSPMTTVFGLASAVLTLLAKPMRGDDLAAAIEPIKASSVTVGEELMSMANSLLASSGERLRNIVDIQQHDVEQLWIVSESTLHIGLVLNRLVEANTAQVAKKEGKEARQTRSALSLLLPGVVAKYNAAVATLLTIVTAVPDSEAPSIELEDVASVAASTKPFISGVLADAWESRVKARGSLAAMLKEMTL